MARIADYDQVQRVMAERGFVSLYHNSGAFGFPPGAAAQSVGWIEAEDPTIREAARAIARRVTSITDAFAAVIDRLPGEAWLMPKSHWHYELHFGNRPLLTSALAKLGVDVAALRDRNDGSAIIFSASEHQLLSETVAALLAGLRGSDFLLVFPDAMTLCTIHHHRQLWWQTSDASIYPILIV